ncbi:MAG: thioredoxin domain-containing protein [Candidatus Dormibacteraeota bacterium]|nr:thioredoxin domain-containing protein [Candidatus Dormibacteraeota bacterium]
MSVNRLSLEKSLYLLQHRSNPVDWYPWGEEAFATARADDRPVLLSVGYSSCHWCHVMAHECFENPEIASLQNRLFVSVKVDREERPDVDRVYMAALQALTGSGGWPMTLFLLPDGRPFFAGTYFPPQDRQGLPGFPRVLAAVAETYRARREEAAHLAGAVTRHLERQVSLDGPRADQLDEVALGEIAKRLVAGADRSHGGFGRAPKFPQAPLLEFLLCRAALDRDAPALEAVAFTLESMAVGGIQDQLEFGFHRYATDARWAVPHFEKMLYDQAQLISCYLHLYQLQGQPEALLTALRTADFALQRMQLPTGAFAASLDADTEGVEGATYLWEEHELRAAVAPDDVAALEQVVKVDPSAIVDGRFVLQGGQRWRDGPAPSGLDPSRDDRIRRQLLAVRRRRPQPVRDDKVIVAWNASMVAALSELAIVTGQGRYLDPAKRLGALLRRAQERSHGLPHLLDLDSGRLTASLEDLAQCALAGLWLHEATAQAGWFAWSLALARQADAELWDSRNALWYDTAGGASQLFGIRPLTVEDGAQRSGNSLMVEVCLRLHGLTLESMWLERAASALSAMRGRSEAMPEGMAGALMCARILDGGPLELAVVTAEGSAGDELVRSARQRHRPDLVIASGRVAEANRDDFAGPPLLRGRDTLAGRATAFVCRDFACLRPTADVQEMVRLLDGHGAA